MRLRRDVLEALARLARSRGVGQAASGTPAVPAFRAAYRLEPGVHGQRVYPGKKGGAATGPNPTDRGKAGTKRHLLTDRRGLPLVELLDAVVPVKGRPGKPRQRPDKLHADKTYDAKRCRRACRQRGIQPHIARRGVESSERLGRHRWVVERTLAWFARMRRLSIRYERRLYIHHAFTSLHFTGLLAHLLQCASGTVLKGTVKDLRRASFHHDRIHRVSAHAHQRVVSSRA